MILFTTNRHLLQKLQKLHLKGGKNHQPCKGLAAGEWMEFASCLEWKHQMRPPASLLFSRHGLAISSPQWSRVTCVNAEKFANIQMVKMGVTKFIGCKKVYLGSKAERECWLSNRVKKLREVEESYEEYR